MKLTNPFNTQGLWLRANLHTHTTASDGTVSPQQRLRQYRENGYDVLAITDHRTVTEPGDLDAEGLILLRASEAHPPCPNGPVYHFVCLGLPKSPPDLTALQATDLIETVRAAGGEVILAHPYWCGRTIEQILAMENVIAIEVYNSTCGRIGKAYSSVHWDLLLQTGRTLGAVAVDDTHRDDDLFGGWTMLKCAERTAAAVMTALRTGCYYATCGPEIKDFRLKDGIVTASFSAAREAHVMCRGSCGRSTYATEGNLITQIETQIPATASYVRLEIVGSDGRRAWTNPTPVPAG